MTARHDKLGIIKMLILTVLVIFAFAKTALSFTTATYDKGLLVPVTVHSENGSLDTAVGITCAKVADEDEGLTVYWTFFDVNSHPVVDGQFTCSDNDLVQFSLNENTSNIEGVDGYLVFTAGKIPADSNDVNATCTGLIAGNAFLIDAANSDAVFVPTVPLSVYDYTFGDDVTSMNCSTVKSLSHGLVNADDSYVDIRYWIDPAFDAETHIVIWSTACIEASDTNTTSMENCYIDPATDEFKCHVDVYDDDEHRHSVSLPMGCELTLIDPSKVVGWPDYTDGFVRIPVKNLMPTSTDGAFAFSYIRSPAFGAAQTLLAAQSGLCPPSAPTLVLEGVSVSEPTPSR